MTDELLPILIKILPGELEALKLAHDNDDIHELKRLIHKLRGALCYCNVPPLLHTAAELELALKRNNLNDVATLFKKLEIEIAVVMKKNSTSE